MPAISERLREAREGLGFSQQVLAERCGVTARSQRNYEAGERYPDAAYLAALSAAGADILYILTGQRLKDSVAESIRGMPERVREVRGPLSEVEFAAAWGIGTEQLAQIESGQRPPSAALLKRLCELYPDDANYLLTGAHPQLDAPLNAREVVLVTNYRACSDAGKRVIENTASFAAQSDQCKKA